MGWTHVMCGVCWNERNPDEEPVALKNAPVEKCCFCAGLTNTGIYIREDPKLTKCGEECDL